MVKRAVLCGCNYPGSKAELAGCVNDVFMIKKMLIDARGFEEEYIKILVDTDSSYTSPTGENIKVALDEMCSAAQPGDTLVFHFSGHGTQVPSDNDDDEADRKDEAICPTDMNLIVDDDLKSIVSKIPEECNFTFISDCCHSGSMLDHSAVHIDGPKAGGTGQQLPEPSSLLNFLGGTRSLDPNDISIKSRELPPSTVASILSEKLGRSINTRDIRGGLGAAFGPAASGFVTKLTGNAMLGQVVAQALSSAGGHQTGSSGVGGLGSMFGGSGGSSLGGLTSMLGGASSQTSSGSGIGGMLGSMLGGSSGGTTAAPSAPPKPDPLHPDKGILITGCQAHETSADVRPPGGDAFGALTHTLVSTVMENPESSYVDVVTKVRAKMVEKNFAQNPCLECSELNASRPFIS
eukprot:Plantae.Rhodophyta-Purpureofilum_apyrenoidigerum.ctg30431.p1 GENE.Plantae.Rhodophyta-Purpureofilum_apyrenoidigerum.ctg30431~~Plantae.Rhodophyta-Purpureofilum_apyrenoidigerum.ctg30431.p1  ORF type:complete len:406 (-),score=53.69 Plantae.Rhodophyta-Purpureofilum_apyrenoidigerum.ctg30431:559-1776(-)